VLGEKWVSDDCSYLCKGLILIDLRKTASKKCISFNVGVELAQIVIVSGVVFLLFFIKSLNLNYKEIVIVPASIVISLIGIWWGIERIIG
jgi:hypothetical protein